MRETPYENAVESSEWRLERSDNVRHSRSYACCAEPYVDVEFQLVLRRRPTFASHLFVAPSVVLCLVTPAVFALPPAALEKLTLGKLRCQHSYLLLSSVFHRPLTLSFQA